MDNPLAESVPYFNEYFGLWAMLEREFESRAEIARGLNLAAHMGSEHAAAIRRSGGRVSADQQNGVAVLSMSGAMMKHASSMGEGTSTVRMRQAIRDAVADDSVGAIVLKIDSPGGTVAGTRELATEVANAKKTKPVFAYAEDLAASAAYWVASQATELFANETGQIGSIGTYGVVHDLSGAAEKAGIKVHVVRAGDFKGVGIAGTEVTDSQLSEMQRLVDGLNEHFIAGVTSGRRMPIAKVRELADGRVHLAADAKQLGLIDGISTFDELLQRAMDAANNTRKPLAASVGNPVSLTSEGQNMSDTQTVEAAVPQAATIAQLKVACSGATPDFLLQQMESAATLDAAKSAWINCLNEQLATLAEENSNLKAEAEKREKLALKPGAVIRGTSAVAVDTQYTATYSSKERWDEEVQRYVKSGMPRSQALLRVNKENPGLREQMLAEVS